MLLIPCTSYIQHSIRHALSKIQSINTIHDEYQLPHVAVSKCHLQVVYQNKGAQVHTPVPVRIVLTVVTKPQSVTPFSRIKNS